MEESLYKRIGIYGIINNVNGNVYVGQRWIFRDLPYMR